MEDKMTINGRTLGLYYSIGADAEIDDEMQKIAVADFGAFIDRLGPGRAYAKLAAILNKWYCIQNGGEPISEKDFLLLSAHEFQNLREAVIKAMAEDKKTQIKAKPVKGKNAESADA